MMSVGLRLGRDICGDLAAAEAREWLVANGKGGYASGTVASLPTRGYHGLLVAALDPPLGRTLTLVTVLETAAVAGVDHELSTVRWAGGTVAPAGYKLIESFTLEGTIPVWRFACADALIEKRVWMEVGANTTCVRYTLLSGHEPVALTLKAIVDYRDYHSRSSAYQWRADVAVDGAGVRVTPFGGAVPLHLRVSDGAATAADEWYTGFDLARERERGLQDREDHLHAATFTATLRPAQPVLFVASTEGPVAPDPTSQERRRRHEAGLLERFAATRPDGGAAAPDWVKRFVLAADQFVVDRATPDDPDGKTIIAGYHWFADWGRDTMISLPGLTLATGRPEIARSILRTFARFVDRGMLPNRFPDAGDRPEYNTADATFWFFDAVRRYHAATRDDPTLRELFPVLAGIIDWHRKGTRYNIRLDPADGLIHTGEAGVQLTWMDAKVGDWVVTPRTGKPIEINALWYNALRAMAAFADRLGEPAGEFRRQAEATLQGFERFWNDAAGCCFDVLDGPDGHESRLRPNQIFAVSLPHSPLAPDRQRAVVRACERALLTSAGLRSLDPAAPDYQPRFGGDPASRDQAYHRGTVWAWLIGPFIEAHLRVYGDEQWARHRLAPLADQLLSGGLGTVNEVFEGAPPHTPRGCIAQAWSVAEYLRAWGLVEDFATRRQGDGGCADDHGIERTSAAGGVEERHGAVAALGPVS